MRILIKEKLSEHKSKTPEGYLICQDAILARTGTQDYLKSEIYENFDGEDTVVSVERKPEQVFSAEALASFEDKPITVEHPDENVNPDNYSELAVGHTRNIRKGKFNGQDVMIGDLVITDAQTIEDIENGVRTELSCGYDCDITEGDHPEQINIRGNHVALCEQGRAGIAKIIDSIKTKDVNPRKGESKEDFIARFMSETKEEYPDEKQRLAVAYSYWNKKDKVKDSKNSLPAKEKTQLSKYFSAVSKHMSKDVSIEDIINPIKEMGYKPVRDHIDGWNLMGDGYYRKDYYFTLEGYDDIFMVSLYAKGNGDWDVNEVNAYFIGNRKTTDSIMQEYEMIRRANETKYGKDFMKYIEKYLSLPENSQIIENKMPSGYTEKRPKLLLSDLYYKKDEWNKFMEWYEKEKVKVTDARPDDAPLRVCRSCLMGIEAHEGPQITRHIWVDEEDEEESKCDWCEEIGFDELWEILDSAEKTNFEDAATDVKDAKTPWTVMFGWAMDNGDPYTGTAIVYAHSEDEAKEILKSYKPKAGYFRVKKGKLVNSFDYPTYFVKKEDLHEDEDEDDTDTAIKDESAYKNIMIDKFGAYDVYEDDTFIDVVFIILADFKKAKNVLKEKNIPYLEYEDEQAYYLNINKDDFDQGFNFSNNMKKDSNDKYVLFIENDKIKGTNTENYNAGIRNGNAVINFNGFKTFEACIEYLLKNTKLKREDIVTIGDTEIEDIKIHDDNNYSSRFYKKSLKELNKKLKDLEKVDDAEFDETASEYNSQKNSIYKEIQNQIKKYEEKLMEDEDTPLTEETKIKEWYCKVFSTDDEGKRINEKVTFGDLFNCLDNYQDVYKCLGVSDSTIRERCFDALAKIINAPYSYIYDQWLKGND